MISTEQFNELINDYSEDIKIELIKNNDFMFSFLNDDDWSMIIKSHALIETVLTELIMTRLIEMKIKPIIERMPLHDSNVSKIKVLKAYSLIPDEQVAFIQKISEIRNKIVHKFENIDFSLDDYVSALDKNQKKNWIKILTWHGRPSTNQQLQKTLPIENPKRAIWISIFLLITETVFKISEQKAQNRLKGDSIKTSSDLLNM